MKKDLTEVVFILDRSGSMSGLEKDTIGGFNSLIDKQRREPGEAVVSLVLFNEEMKVVHDRMDIKQVGKLTSEEYYATGCTALLDAVGSTIKRIMKTQTEINDDDKPEKTIIIITTDGLENSSCEFDYKDVKQLITQAKEIGYEFIFLGANIDSVEEAEKIGISYEKAALYNNDEKGIQINYEAIDVAISMCRKEKQLSQRWREAIDLDGSRKK